MKNASPYLVIALLLLSFISGYYYGRHQLKVELRSSAGLDNVDIQKRKATITALNNERDSLKSELSTVLSDRDALQNSHGKFLQELRKNAPVYVRTTTIRQAECDSIKSAADGFRQEADIQRIARINCEEVAAIQEIALQNQEDELIAADLRHDEDQADRITITDDRDEQTRLKKAWRKVAVVATTTTVILATIIVLL